MICEQKKVFVIPSLLPKQKFDWETMKELWDSFSLVPSINKNSTDTECEKMIQKINEMEKWYSVPIHSYHFVNRVFFQMFQLKEIIPLKIYQELFIFIWKENIISMGLFNDVKGNFFKLRIKGNNVFYQFYIINELIESSPPFSSEFKDHSYLSHTPLYCCENSVETKFLEKALLSHRLFCCPFCERNLKISHVAPYLCMDVPFPNDLIQENIDLLDKIHSGSQGSIYKSYFKEKPIVVKVLNLNDEFEDQELENLNLISSWRQNFFNYLII